MQIAARKLAKFCRHPWPSYWTTKTVGRYPDQRTVFAKDVQSNEIHSIMCQHGEGVDE